MSAANAPLIERAGLVTRVLALPAGALELLCTLAAIDFDPSHATAMQAHDEHQRAGVVSWRSLAHIAEGWDRAIDSLDAIVGSVVDWGLAQVVGAAHGDVRVPGTSAIRLTHWGRIALGLGPLCSAPIEADEPSGWTVLHGDTRERMLWAATERLGDHPTVLPLPRELDQLSRTCGQIAAALLHGPVVLDATTLPGDVPASMFDDLLDRTARARRERVLLVGDPQPVRWGAALAGARLVWSSRATTSRPSAVSDAVTARLLEQPGATAADVMGVRASTLARPRRVQVCWEDIDLPANVARRLQLAMVHARARVAGSVSPSNRRRQRGYRLLLSGLPGTGKSMTAGIIASELDLPLVRLDLSTVLSRWLGETEKILSEVFDMAEATRTLLVLDEAESLFRQRDSGPGGTSGLATAVSYLLARLDDFDGALIATTNRAEDLDEAFFRRFDDYFVLPMPDVKTRERLWARMLHEPTDQVDVPFLAGRFSISGGVIEGAAARARAWSSALGDTLDTALVLASLVLELEKNNRSADHVYATPYEARIRAFLGHAEPVVGAY